MISSYFLIHLDFQRFWSSPVWHFKFINLYDWSWSNNMSISYFLKNNKKKTKSTHLLDFILKSHSKVTQKNTQWCSRFYAFDLNSPIIRHFIICIIIVHYNKLQKANIRSENSSSFILYWHIICLLSKQTINGVWRSSLTFIYCY